MSSNYILKKWSPNLQSKEPSSTHSPFQQTCEKRIEHEYIQQGQSMKYFKSLAKKYLLVIWNVLISYQDLKMFVTS